MTKTPDIREAEQQAIVEAILLSLAGDLDAVKARDALLALIATQRQQADQAARREELELLLTLWGKSDPSAIINISVMDYVYGRIAALGDVVGEQR